ncbi:MAG: hypothetical protein L6R42_004897, partial [Xanthoria sp. 1 TBL-2021]
HSRKLQLALQHSQSVTNVTIPAKPIADTMETASKLPTVLHKQHTDNESIAAMNNDPIQENPLSSLRSRLPQELVDQIRDAFLDLALLPGHFVPQIRDQETYSWNEKQARRIARPDLLTLNRSIYKRYHHRMWTDNTCVFISKDKNPKYYELIPVEGRLSDPYDYLNSYIDNEEDLSWSKQPLREYREDAQEPIEVHQVYATALQLHESSARNLGWHLLCACKLD